MRGFDRIELGFLIERPLLESILISDLFLACAVNTNIFQVVVKK